MKDSHYLLSLILLFLTASAALAQSLPARSPMAFEACYAPGTPLEVIQKHAAPLPGVVPSSLRLPIDGFTFDDDDRWSETATDAGPLGQGDPTTLTWSITPDGTSIFGYNGEPTSDSGLEACLDVIYGSSAVWLPLFEQVFARWGELNGVTYVYEPNDDGDPWTSNDIADGVLGVRGDVRIGGHPIDGNSGILAYNFFPDFGDMVIDCPDTFYNNTTNESLGLRNVLAHEHGHGLGIRHVCPIEQTKLMEPFLTTAFDGPQHDDILAANRGYGDTDEHNDTSGTAADLGLLDGVLSFSNRSIDDNGDIDLWSFSIAGASTISLTLTPDGSTYLSGPQNPNGTCSAGVPFDTLNVHDLGLRVLDTDGSTALASADDNPVGGSETLTKVALDDAGTYFIEADGDSTNAAQLLQLDIDVMGATTIFTDGFESGDTTAWSNTVP